MELRDYFSGSFMWTGFDYRGEPNPFVYTNFASSFGPIDLCGMEKPPFYYYKAWWTDEPVLKLTPHWNHKDGDLVTVAVFTNCEEITLSLNGRPIETVRIERFDAPLFEVPFERGVLSVTGKRNGAVLQDQLITSGDPTVVQCTQVLEAHSEDDVAIYEMNAYDEKGDFCPLAADEIEIEIENGDVIGVGNGDPSSVDYERKPLIEKTYPIRRLGDGKGLYSIPEKAKNTRLPREDFLELEPRREDYDDDFRLVARYKTSAPKEHTKELVATVTLTEAYEYIELERLGGEAEVYLDGALLGDNLRCYGRQCNNANRPYRFYGDFKKGAHEIKIVCRYEARDLPLISGYVKLGKRVNDPWRVRLHYGKARIFVRSATPEAVRIVPRIV